MIRRKSTLKHQLMRILPVNCRLLLKLMQKVIFQEIVISSLGVFIKEKERSNGANVDQNIVVQYSKPLNNLWCLQNHVNLVTSCFGWFWYAPDMNIFSRV